MKKLALILGSFLVPVVASAALDELEQLSTDIGDIVNTLIPIVFAIALLVFFWGLVRYIFGAEHDKEKAKKTMLWGVIALFVMASIWGLVTFLGENLGIGQDVAPDVDSLIPN